MWESEVAKFGIDIWMTTEAIASGARVCQSFLGAKIHNPKDPAADLSAMLVQVLGAVFALMEDHYAVWAKTDGSNAVPLFGFQYEVGVEPVNVNVDRMISTFRQGLSDLGTIWDQILAPGTRQSLRLLGTCSLQDFRIPDNLWARVVYDAAVAYRNRVLPRDHVLKAFTPLYLGRTASFVLDTQGLTSSEAEGRIEALCQAFEKDKSYLVARWNEPHAS
ncbi:MAG: hypothetical protein H0X01_04085 [Nitrospira sp.]|nr:hypothetical protein [Nitrospira sp.]